MGREALFFSLAVHYNVHYSLLILHKRKPLFDTSFFYEKRFYWRFWLDRFCMQFAHFLVTGEKTWNSKPEDMLHLVQATFYYFNPRAIHIGQGWLLSFISVIKTKNFKYIINETTCCNIKILSCKLSGHI